MSEPNMDDFLEESSSIQRSDVPIFDERERKSGFLDVLDRLNYKYNVEVLGIGDAVVSEECVIEIKRITKKVDQYQHIQVSNDLEASLHDNRLLVQSANRARAFKKSFMIIQCEKNTPMFNAYFTKDHWDSIAITQGVEFNTTILFSETMEETAKLIYEIWRKEKSSGHYIPPRNKQPMPRTDREQQLFFLEGLVDVGNKTALELLDIFKEPIQVLAWILDTKVEYTKTNNPKAIKGGIKGYGPQFFLKNQQMLTQLAKNKPLKK